MMVLFKPTCHSHVSSGHCIHASQRRKKNCVSSSRSRVKTDHLTCQYQHHTVSGAFCAVLHHLMSISLCRPHCRNPTRRFANKHVRVNSRVFSFQPLFECGAVRHWPDSVQLMLSHRDSVHSATYVSCSISIQPHIVELCCMETDDLLTSVVTCHCHACSSCWESLSSRTGGAES